MRPPQSRHNQKGQRSCYDKQAYGGQGTYCIWNAIKGHGNRWTQNQFPPESELPGLSLVTETYATSLGDLAKAMLPVSTRCLWECNEICCEKKMREVFRSNTYIKNHRDLTKNPR